MEVKLCPALSCYSLPRRPRPGRHLRPVRAAADLCGATERNHAGLPTSRTLAKSEQGPCLSHCSHDAPEGHLVCAFLRVNWTVMKQNTF